MGWTFPYGWEPTGAAGFEMDADPPEVPAGFLHTVVPGDTLYNLASRYGISVETIMAVNPGVVPENLMVGSVLRIPVPGVVTYIRYTIRPGDTLWLLGQRFGVDWRRLARINHIMDPTNLMVGMTLLIPA